MITVDLQHQLRCPGCGDEHTHLEQAFIAARPVEDGPITELVVSAAGDVHTGTDLTPTATAGIGRRHRIALAGYCESCYQTFALVFTQHKGVTFAETTHLGQLHQEVA